MEDYNTLNTNLDQNRASSNLIGSQEQVKMTRTTDTSSILQNFPRSVDKVGLRSQGLVSDHISGQVMINITKFQVNIAHIQKILGGSTSLKDIKVRVVFDQLIHKLKSPDQFSNIRFPYYEKPEYGKSEAEDSITEFEAIL